MPTTGKHPHTPDDGRPRMMYVDWADLEAKMTPGSGDAASKPAAKPARRILRRVKDEVAPVRANVQDAARAVAEWVAAVVDHEGKSNLDRVLNRCLRPGPDVTAVNYAAVAAEIQKTLGIELSAQRVQTAVEHLRRAHDNEPRTMAKNANIKQSLDALHGRLEGHFIALTLGRGDEAMKLHRELATAILGAVRAAAGRVIDCEYGEGIPREIDIDRLETDFLHFVRDMVREGAIAIEARELESDLRKLLITLGDYDGSAAGDMRLVVHGARVVAALAGPDTLPGVMAQLNVLVAGRNLIDTELYCAEMDRLAALAVALHDDEATAIYMNWVRRLDEDQRVPSPLRVASYCRNNLATHILDKLFMDELKDTGAWLPRAQHVIEAMIASDGGFQLIRVTQAIYFTVLAKLQSSPAAIEAYYRDLGPDKTLSLMEDLIRYESCDALVQAARAHAVTVFPALKHQIIHTR